MNTICYQYANNRFNDIAKKEVIPIPYIKNIPNRKDYGLTENTEIELKKNR